MPFKNRIRLPMYIKAPQFPAEANRFRLSDGSKKTLSVVIRKTFQLVTDYMPARMHQRLTIALNHDQVKIEGDRYAGNVVVDGEYKIDWPEFLDYPLGQAEVQVEVTPFPATNDNCQTCEEASQLDAVDNTVPDDINEGDTVNVNVFTNSTICCFPFTAEIVYFNPDYVDSATINSETGEVTIIMKDPTPSLDGVVLVRYRITCANGVFDEAEIIGNVVGSIVGCDVPSGLTYEEIDENEDQISWAETADFEWQLYTCDNLGTPIQTGTSSGNSETFTDLSPSQCYKFSIRKDCGGGSFSAWTELEFTKPAANTDCGRFEVTADDGTTNPTPYNFSFMDCNGVIISLTVINLQTRTFCFLEDALDNPVYFVGDFPVSYQRISDCGF